MTAEEKFEESKRKIAFYKRKGKVDCCWAAEGRLTTDQIKELELDGNKVWFNESDYVTVVSWENVKQ